MARCLYMNLRPDEKKNLCNVVSVFFLYLTLGQLVSLLCRVSFQMKVFFPRVISKALLHDDYLLANLILFYFNFFF